MTDDQHRTAPGVAEVRLSGRPEDTSALMAVLERLAADDVRIKILTRSAPYANRRDTGQRIYLTVRVESSPAGDAS